MNELEQRLVALGRELELPAVPDAASIVLGRLEGRRPFPWRAVAIAFAIAAMAAGAAFAVPQARSAILRFFHLGGASVVRVETLPPAVERSEAGGLGKPLTRAEAERRVGFTLVLPPVPGDGPKRVYVLGSSLASVLLHADGKPVVLSEFRSQRGLLRKLVSDHSGVDPVRVAGAPGLWVHGPPHVLTYFDRDRGFQERPIRIHGNVLLWTHGPLTLRLEGRLTRAQALELARRVG